MREERAYSWQVARRAGNDGTLQADWLEVCEGPSSGRRREHEEEARLVFLIKASLCKAPCHQAGAQVCGMPEYRTQN